MIKRTLDKKILKAAKEYPVVSITGPRQSGKTTLVKMLFPNYDYVSLENPDNRLFAMDDPNGFLQRYNKGVILDEIQRTPDLFSYIQTIVDEKDTPGRFILSGSQNFLLIEKISQSLSGRSAIFHLLPFSRRELINAEDVSPEDFPQIADLEKKDEDLWEMLIKGFYPRIYDKGLDAHEWLSGYYQTYIERDVRSVINVGDLEIFGRFIRLCAGRNGQIINYSSLAADCGVSNMTVKRWLSVLQASFIIAQVRPHYENFSKRMIKAPKLYFLDTGLLTFLLGIRNKDDLYIHALRGSVFESFVFSELYKSYLHHGMIPQIYFWRDTKGHEVDFILERGSKLLPIEVKSGSTIVSDSLKGLKYYRDLAGDKCETPVLVYGGDDSYIRNDMQVLSWRAM